MNEVEVEEEEVEVDLTLIVVHRDTRDLLRLGVVTPQIIVRHHQDERLIRIFPVVEVDGVLTTDDVVHQPRLVPYLHLVPVLAPSPHHGDVATRPVDLLHLYGEEEMEEGAGLQIVVMIAPEP